MHHQHAIYYIYHAELCHPGQRERGMQVRVKEAKLLLVNPSQLHILCEDVDLGFEISFSSECFTLELYLCQRGNPCWKKSILKPSYSAIPLDQSHLLENLN